MRTRNRLIAGMLLAVAAGGAAVALGVALLLGNIVHLRATANATLGTGTGNDRARPAAPARRTDLTVRQPRA